jgi:phenylalanyl-tRNA synthetase beta chain
MKLSYNWLAEFVDISDIDPYEIGLKLTMSTSEIESVEETGYELPKVVIGKILEVKTHPNSDHLFSTRIDVGTEVLHIVSGAPNTRKDTFVPVALIGGKLADGTRVKKARLRGVDSFGVVCSEKELGISEDHTGLWILDDEEIEKVQLKPGKALSSLFQTKDYIIEIDNKSITNRPDLWGHYGFARELSAIYRKEMKPLYPSEEIDEILQTESRDTVRIRILDRDLCPRYTAIKMGGIKVKKSPFLVRRRLFTLGIRPIYNIVDVTNYVMLETGQPLHAFDATQIARQEIVVRRAQEKEKFTTLDGFERSLTKETLLITDPEKAVAVAGVMGGLNSEISDFTETIIIEAANFNPVNIRRTALRLGLRTEASNRFEKGIDPQLTLMGIVGSVSMIKKVLPAARILSPLCDANCTESRGTELKLDTDWITKLLGVNIHKNRIREILQSLQFGVSYQDGNEKSMMVSVPSFRAIKDITMPEDVVEEVGRIYGYGSIEPQLPLITSEPPHRDEMVQFKRQLKLLFSTELTLTEVYTYSFQEDSILRLFYPEEEAFLKLKNPVSTTMSRLRRSLIPGLYALIEKNAPFKNTLSIYEIGAVYNPRSSAKDRGGHKKDFNERLPDERVMASALVLNKKDASPVFYTAKGKLEILFEKLNISEIEFAPFDSLGSYKNCINVQSIGEPDVYHPGRRALLVDGDTCFGVVAELNPGLLKSSGIDFRLFRAAVFDIDVFLLLERYKHYRNQKKYEKIHRYPEVALAYAVVVEEEVPVREVRDFIVTCGASRKGSGVSLMDHVELFDIYRGKPLSPGKKSLAFNVFYRHRDRTLTEKEANLVHEDIARKIRERGWELR